MSGDFSVPWKRWGLQLTRAGDAIEWTAIGFRVVDPPGLFPYRGLGSVGAMIWGVQWLGGEPPAIPEFPKEIYDYLVAQAGPAPAGHPFHDLERNGYRPNLADAGVWQPGVTYGLFVEEARFVRILLAKPGSATPPTILVRGDFHLGDAGSDCMADAFRWRQARVALFLPGDLQGFRLHVNSLRLAPAWYHLPGEGQGTTVGMDPDAQRALLAPYGADGVCDDPTGPDASPLGATRIQATPLWGQDHDRFANRAVIADATFRWDGNDKGDIRVDFSGCDHTPNGMAFALANPFPNPETGEEGPFPYHAAPIFTVPGDGTIAFQDFLAWARSCGVEADEAAGRLDVTLWVWLDYLEDTPLSVTGGLKTLDIHWENNVTTP